ncbi:MAG: phosphoglycerate dehydrogenase [Methanomassiliicoccaceae archaeon]|jgi:D-3-phosphoglycerate dehydrogenase|nr:phosphoglycerate dehydrogenase [Methanomassiliicoccaceae archaeon]
MKLLVSDPLSEEGLKILTASGVPVDVRPGLNEDELCKIIGEYDGLIIRSGTTVTKKIMDAGKKLRVIGRAGVGVDNVDVAYATQKGILVMNTPSANIISAAEHSIAMIMSLARMIPWAHMSVHKGEWKRNKFTGVEIYGKTLGIIGVGRVGGEIAKRMKAFNMTMIGYDPYLPKDVAESLGVKLTTLGEVLMNSDIMTIHTPLLPETRNMISTAQFKMMKKNALLVNVARGGIVNEDDLFEALKNRTIAGAAFDVFVDEPLKEGCRLLELDNLVTTPHLGASTVEAQEKVSVDIAENVVAYLRDNIISNAINAPRGQMDPMIAPYVPLAERLGIFIHQLNGLRPVDKIEVMCSGEIALKNDKMITLAALIGMMKNIVGDTVNMVNAESLAKSKNIKVTESKNEDSPVYSNMVTVTITSGKDVRSVRGTVFAQTPRLIGIDNHCFEIPMDTDLLFAKYNDRPGVIGSVGKILGENNINIGQMTVGRDVSKGMAIMLMGVDHEVPAELIKKISDATGFDETKFIKLVE